MERTLLNAPRHIAIIMDGNGRWAESRGLPRLQGHRRGADRVREIVESCPDLGVTHLTLFAFSTENWSRPLDEVRAKEGTKAYLQRRDGPFQPEPFGPRAKKKP